MTHSEPIEIVEELLIGLRNAGIITNETRHSVNIEAPHADTAVVGLQISGRTYVITVEDVTS